MNKQLYKLSFIIIGVLTIVLNYSCKKALNAAPMDATSSTNFWTSQQSVEEASVAMYGQLRSNFRNNNCYFMFGDYVGGLFEWNSQWNWSVLTATSPIYHTTPYCFALSAAYYFENFVNPSVFYQLIAQANLILQEVPTMNPSLFQPGQQNAYLGEALFMRAYTYFYVSRVWGDPVYVSKTYNNANFSEIPPLPRSPQDSVLNLELNDLRTAASYLNYEGSNPTATIRANKGSAQALMAEIFEWQHQYDSAHYYCQQVMNNGGYTLEPAATYTNIWAGQQSNESIFELATTFNSNDPSFTNPNLGNNYSWNEATFSFFGKFLKGSIVNNINSSCWLSPKDAFVDNTFDTSDMRYKTILKPMAASGGDAAGYMLTKYTNFKFQTAGNNSSTYIDNDLVLIRLSDIILLDAEALAYKGDFAGAKADLAMTEGRAGITSYQNVSQDIPDMVQEVVNERGRELIGEGQWYYDLIRTEPTIHGLEAVGYPVNRITPAEQGYYWPLDMGALYKYDPLLTQIPYWEQNTFFY